SKPCGVILSSLRLESLQHVLALDGIEAEIVAMLRTEPIPERAEFRLVAGRKFVEQRPGHREQRQYVVVETGAKAPDPGMTTSLGVTQVTGRTSMYSGIGLSKRLQSSIEGAITHRPMRFAGEGFIVEFDVGAGCSLKCLGEAHCTDRDVGLLITS